MALKKLSKSIKLAEKNVEKQESLLKDVRNELMSVLDDIARLTEKKVQLEEKYISIQIFPFRIGDYALAEVSSGRNKKWQKCLLECENGILYVRPVKEDGELSGRHFSIVPCGEQKYIDFLKEV